MKQQLNGHTKEAFKQCSCYLNIQDRVKSYLITGMEILLLMCSYITAKCVVSRSLIFFFPLSLCRSPNPAP